MLLYVGSHAFNTVTNSLKRKPKDIDVIASYEDGVKFLKSNRCDIIEPIGGGTKLHGVILDDEKTKARLHFEVEIAWPGSTAESLLTAVWAQSVPDSYRPDARHAPLDVLYTLKMSHRYRKNSPHFLKTMRDIQAMRTLGASIPEALAEWYKVRMKETYNYGHPKLNTTKKNFFADDGVPYKYDHDTIHEAVKIMDRPAFDYFKPDTSEVFCSKDMFFSIDPQIRINAVYEETAVLALERSIIPNPGALTHDSAFATSLGKVATSITSGWFREFAWENYDATMQLYRELCDRGQGYVTRFERGLAEGILKPYTQG